MNPAMLGPLHPDTDGRAEIRLDALLDEVGRHDAYTHEHCGRVADYCEAIARELGLQRHDIAFLRTAGLVHDIGKMGVPEWVLAKKGALTPDEIVLIRSHPVIGANLLAKVDGMERMAAVALHHHENWDGTGYPKGLSGVDIPIEARIVYVADAFDAMTSERPYGRVRTVEEALAELRRCAGRQFDPMVVDCMHAAYHHGLLDDIARPQRRLAASA